MPASTLLECPRGVVEEGLSKQERRVCPDRREVGRLPRRQKGDVRESKRCEQATELVLYDIGKRTDDEKRRPSAGLSR
ncbi:hypothetical protein ABTP95_19870, partial [Acinetobacter baumannii]